jgi:hypothetical protein
MSADKSLKKIDTGYWQTKDERWVEERQAQWDAVEKVISRNRRKGDVNVIKEYFLRGKMPNWKKYKDWDDLFRHLDLDLFLLFHPSNDPQILKDLYKTYMESDLIHEGDVLGGYGALLDNEFLRAPLSWESLDEYPFPYRGAKNIIIFRILFGDVEYARDRILNLVGGQENFEKKAKHLFEFLGYHHFLHMTDLLFQDLRSPLCLHNLYQYEDVLDWCLTTLTPNKEKEFLEGLKTPQYLESFQRTLFCINNFDTEKEGDNFRTHFIYKVRKILDGHPFVPEFKQMWEDIKAGKIKVKNPWKR